MRREQGIEVEVHDSALDALVDAGGFDAELGARPMRRTIGREVETPLATRILEGSLGVGDFVRLTGRSAGAGADLRAHVELETVRGVDTEAASL
jgi:ATP-dependent Clp protease ATP-binding subunit ClpC